MPSARYAPAQRLPRVPLLCAALALSLGACAAEPPLVPRAEDSSGAAQYRSLAFTADVNARTGAISIAAPLRTGQGAPSLTRAGSADAPALSLLGGDAARLTATGLRTSRVGAFTPGMVRVTFDVTLASRLPTLRFVPPTWPTPPAPYVTLFPLEVTALVTTGDVIGGDANVIEIVTPSGGTVRPSPEWNGTGEPRSGEPWNFFTTRQCTDVGPPECARWVAMGLPSASGTASLTRRVGFDMTAGVAQFRARFIVAADVAPAISTP